MVSQEQTKEIASQPAQNGHASDANVWLSAIVENSSDAIISKSLDGTITSWNRGAEALFGYSADEAIGQCITMLIPEDHLPEEEEILSRLHKGHKVEPFETIRRHKDGTLIDISVTISPVTDQRGTILGASKIARDIGAQKRANAQQALLLREMHHRIKNLFTLTAGLVSLSARATTGGEAFASDLHARLRSLARAHELTMPSLGEVVEEPNTTMHALLEAILSPYRFEANPRISITGQDVPLAERALTSIALLMHELTTNAAKYGALSRPEGYLAVHLSEHDDRLRMVWTETKSAAAAEPTAGFGSTLENLAITNLEGELTREWRDDGVIISLEVPRSHLIGRISHAQDPAR